MSRSSFVFVLAVLVICAFCGEDFVSLGRHSWQCKKKTSFNTGDSFANDQQSHQQLDSNVQADPSNIGKSLSPSNCHNVKCCSGKLCKGLRDLKMHQRNCRVVKDLNDEPFDFVEENLTGSYNNDNSSHDLDYILNNSLPDPGVKLPKSDGQWKVANSFFMVLQPICGLTLSSINDSIVLMNSTIYIFLKIILVIWRILLAIS